MTEFEKERLLESCGIVSFSLFYENFVTIERMTGNPETCIDDIYDIFVSLKESFNFSIDVAMKYLSNYYEFLSGFSAECSEEVLTDRVEHENLFREFILRMTRLQVESGQSTIYSLNELEEIFVNIPDICEILCLDTGYEFEFANYEDYVNVYIKEYEKFLKGDSYFTRDKLEGKFF